jgi:hypothetical protein
MRILLDECLPRGLAGQLTGQYVKTVPQVGWASIGNGKLLLLIAESGKFDVFLTMDKNLPRQNQIRELPFAIVILRAKSNRLEHVLPFAAELLRRLSEFKAGNTYILRQPA